MNKYKYIKINLKLEQRERERVWQKKRRREVTPYYFLCFMEIKYNTNRLFTKIVFFSIFFY